MKKLEQTLREMREKRTEDLPKYIYALDRATEDSLEAKLNILVIDETIWAQDLQKALEFLRENDINEIVYSTQSSSTTEVLCMMLKNGCEILGVYEYTSRHDDKRQGLHISI